MGSRSPISLATSHSSSSPKRMRVPEVAPIARMAWAAASPSTPGRWLTAKSPKQSS